MLNDFAGRTGVVTGAGGGFGRALALRLSGLGLRLALLDVDAGGLETTAQELPGASETYLADVADAAAVEHVAARVVSELGVPSLLVNNAGRLGPFDRRSWEISADDWQSVCSANIYGTANCVRSFLPAMLASGAPGHVVNVSSMGGMVTGPLLAPYRASKFAVRAFSETLHCELTAENACIGVSVVCPGGVATNLNRAVRERRRAAGEPGQQPGSAQVTADDVAARTVDAVRDGRLYVFTHAGSEERVLDYQARISRSLAAPGQPAADSAHA